MMRTRQATQTLLLITMLSATLAAWQASPKPASDAYVGVWSGSWEGAGGNGGFELTVEKGNDGALAGKVSVTGEPTYSATLKSLSFDGGKMTGKYDFPPDPNLEVTLLATFEASSAKGTWSVVDKGNDVAAGTWNVKKK